MRDYLKLVIVLVILAFLTLAASSYFIGRSKRSSPGNLDGFAKCLKDRGAVFYGAFWCTYCQNQKKLFGDSQKYLPYVECSTPDAKDQTQECKDKQIEQYPTWIFSDGSRESGELTLQELRQKTGCKT